MVHLYAFMDGIVTDARIALLSLFSVSMELIRRSAKIAQSIDGSANMEERGDSV